MEAYGPRAPRGPARAVKRSSFEWARGRRELYNTVVATILEMEKFFRARMRRCFNENRGALAGAVGEYVLNNCV